MRHPDTCGLTPDEQAVYDEWLWLLTRWGAHDVDEAHELALQRAAGERDDILEAPPLSQGPYSASGAYPAMQRPALHRPAL